MRDASIHGYGKIWPEFDEVAATRLLRPKARGNIFDISLQTCVFCLTVLPSWKRKIQTVQTFAFENTDTHELHKSAPFTPVSRVIDAETPCRAHAGPPTFASAFLPDRSRRERAIPRQ